MAALLLLGLLLLLASVFLLLLAAFKESLWWGLGCLLIPFVTLAFIIVHWEKARSPFLAQVVAIALLVGTLMHAGKFESVSRQFTVANARHYFSSQHFAHGRSEVVSNVPDGAAAPEIHKCVNRSGEVTYTDKPCTVWNSEMAVTADAVPVVPATPVNEVRNVIESTVEDATKDLKEQTGKVAEAASKGSDFIQDFNESKKTFQQNRNVVTLPCGQPVCDDKYAGERTETELKQDMKDIE